jgi:CDP-glucose 4,6-dehydratase
MKALPLSRFKGKRVFITGDTGFKGAWLALWLHDLGAKVHGYALPPEKRGDLFNILGLEKLIAHEDGDIRDRRRLALAMKRARPEFVFHLAAQALVRRSYKDPAGTYETNLLGSANLLAAVDACKTVRSLVYVTSDKCYKNKGFSRGYREDDELGGGDPYSSSKAMAEFLFAGWRPSRRVGAASARAGNVIGGGDWAEDRIVPDIVTALSKKRSLVLRNPKAVRPWQHVLEPLYGYLLLASKLRENPRRFSGSWNFGPEAKESRTVRELAQVFSASWNQPLKIKFEPSPLHEAHLLRLDARKARRLGWKPRWDFERGVAETASFYKAVALGADAKAVARRQIREYLV